MFLKSAGPFELVGTLLPWSAGISRHHVAIGGMSNRHPGRPCGNFAFEAEEGGYSADADNDNTPPAMTIMQERRQIMRRRAKRTFLRSDANALKCGYRSGRGHWRKRKAADCPSSTTEKVNFTASEAEHILPRFQDSHQRWWLFYVEGRIFLLRTGTNICWSKSRRASRFLSACEREIVSRQPDQLRGLRRQTASNVHRTIQPWLPEGESYNESQPAN